MTASWCSCSPRGAEALRRDCTRGGRFSEETTGTDGRSLSRREGGTGKAQGLALRGARWEGSPALSSPEAGTDRPARCLGMSVWPPPGRGGGKGFVPQKASAEDAVRGQAQENQDGSRSDRLWAEQRRESGGPGWRKTGKGDGLRKKWNSVQEPECLWVKARGIQEGLSAGREMPVMS